MARSSPSRFGRFIPLLVLAMLLVAPAGGAADVPFVRGDVNGSRRLSVADAVAVLEGFFGQGGGGPALGCLDAADANDDGRADIADAVYLVNYLFGNGPAPPAPFPGCGDDPSKDLLGCESFARCAVDFYDLTLDGDGIFYVIDRSPPMGDLGELARAKREVVANLESFPETFEFGIFFFAADVPRFPASGRPAAATAENKASAIAFLESVHQGSGTCIQQGIVAGLLMANQSSARQRMLVYVGDGGGTCRAANEADYLQETLEVVAAYNTQGVVIHVIGVLLFPARTVQEAFLRELARQNGGTFVNVPPP